jgi:aminoglycoside phosphotransferase (APT) family kinase protein
MQPDEVARIAARTVPGSGPTTIDSLSCGLVNTSYRVARDGRLYVLRLASSSANASALELGLDRAWEMRVLEVASSAGLAPLIEFCDPPAGIVVVRWALGRSWSPDEVQKPENIQRLGALVRRIQALPTPATPRAMSPAAWIDFYRRALQRGAVREREVPRAGSSADCLLAELERLPAASPALCHGDLHRLNLIDGGALVALDWEYSHISDPLWDLAGWSSNSDLGDEARHGLLSGYLERRPTPSDWSRLQVLAALYDHLCLLWSELCLNQRPDADQGLLERMQRLTARLGRGPVVE